MCECDSECECKFLCECVNVGVLVGVCLSESVSGILWPTQHRK